MPTAETGQPHRLLQAPDRRDREWRCSKSTISGRICTAAAASTRPSTASASSWIPGEPRRRRRVGQRQIDDRAVHSAAGAAALRPDRRRLDPLRRTGSAREIRAGDAADPRRQHRDHPAGSDDQPQSGVQHRLSDRRIRSACTSAYRESTARQGDREPAARPGSLARGAHAGLSPPVQRRHAPARGGRDRHRVPAQAAHRRRGDDRARRHDPGPVPGPLAHPAAGARISLSCSSPTTSGSSPRCATTSR